jgi:hypothetical protein
MIGFFAVVDKTTCWGQHPATLPNGTGSAGKTEGKLVSWEAGKGIKKSRVQRFKVQRFRGSWVRGKRQNRRGTDVS